jgi:hypothetical protein
MGQNRYSFLHFRIKIEKVDLIPLNWTKEGRKMKKGMVIAFAALAVLLVVGLAAFSRTSDPATPTEPGNTGVIKPQVEENTLGATQWAAFQQAITVNQNATAEELAATLAESTAELFFGTASPIEKDAEYFAGFDNYRITGYKAVAVYMPMIGSIPFVGYVFELEDGVNPATFLKNLTDNSNPKWNVCVEAEQTVAGAIGNRAFFLMCPKTMG